MALFALQRADITADLLSPALFQWWKGKAQERKGFRWGREGGRGPLLAHTPGGNSEQLPRVSILNTTQSTSGGQARREPTLAVPSRTSPVATEPPGQRGRAVPRHGGRERRLPALAAALRRATWSSTSNSESLQKMKAEAVVSACRLGSSRRHY